MGISSTEPPGAARTGRPRAGQRLAAAGMAVGLAAAVGCTTGEGGEEGERLYVEIIGGEPDLLNPQLSTSPNVRRFSHSVFETLVGVTDEAETFPLLAHDWEFSDDDRTVTFHLEEGVTWHDGEPFTAEDVAFNLEELFPLDPMGGELAERIDSVDTPDSHTVVIDLTAEYAPLLENLATQFLLPRHLYEDTDYATNPANMEPVGTGPFEFEDYAHGEEVTLTRYPEWWQGEIEVDRAVYQIVGDTNARALSLMSGEVDTAVLEPTRQEEVSENPDVQQLEHGEFPAQIFVSFNTRNEELSDPEVRRLVFSAIERDRVAEDGLYGLATPATSFLPPNHDWAEHPDLDFDEEFPHDLDAIQDGLDEAGYPEQDDGTRFSLDVRYITGLADVEPGIELLRSTMESVGIELNLVSGVNMVFLESVYDDHDFDLAIHASRGSPLADPNLGIAQWYTCNPDELATRNPSGGCDEEIDAAAEDALEAVDPEERAEHLHRLQERAAEEMYHAPIVWSDVFLPSVNTTRWEGLDDHDHAAGGVNWLALKWVG